MNNLERKSAEQTVYETIKSAIFNRKIAPGTAMTEQSLCNIFGVSRTPIRGALHKLSEDGYLEIIPNKGASVIQADNKKISQIYDVRIELEILALKKGLDKFNDKDIEILDHLIELEKKAFIQRNFKEYLRINEKFHSLIVSKANNEYLTEIFSKVYRQLLIYLVLYDNFYVPDNKSIFSIYNNKRIIDKIREGNIEELEGLIRLQCKKTIEAINTNYIENAKLEDVFGKGDLW